MHGTLAKKSATPWNSNRSPMKAILTASSPSASDAPPQSLWRPRNRSSCLRAQTPPCTRPKTQAETVSASRINYHRGTSQLQSIFLISRQPRGEFSGGSPISRPLFIQPLIGSQIPYHIQKISNGHAIVFLPERIRHIRNHDWISAGFQK